MANTPPQQKLTPMAMNIIVVMIVILFVVIIVPNLLENDRNAMPIVRVKTNLRLLQKAIESYYTDHGSYPVPVLIADLPQYANQYEKYNHLDIKTVFTGSNTIAGLTTPIAYLETPPIDEMSNLPFAYETIQDRYIIYSPGWDRKFDITNPKHILQGETEQDIKQRVLPKTWDPTNGINSSGDIWQIDGANIEAVY